MEPHNEPTKEKQRTLQQNKSLHLFCRNVANSLNDAGIEMHLFLKDIEVPWSETVIKDIWKAIEYAQTGTKKSTTEMTTKECIEIYETFNRHLSQYGIHEPWPSVEEIANNQLTTNYELFYEHIITHRSF